MIRLTIALFAGSLLAHAAAATPADDVVAPVRQFIDGFNSGDEKAAFATYATGDIAIIDEFAPHIWVGPNAAHAWADAYAKNAAATGVADGKVSYNTPTRSEIEGDKAYVVVPTVYTYKQNGRPIAEEGQITAALVKSAAGWKIRGWTWSGVPPHPAK